MGLGVPIDEAHSAIGFDKDVPPAVGFSATVGAPQVSADSFALEFRSQDDRIGIAPSGAERVAEVGLLFRTSMRRVRQWPYLQRRCAATRCPASLGLTGHPAHRRQQGSLARHTPGFPRRHEAPRVQRVAPGSTSRL